MTSIESLLTTGSGALQSKLETAFDTQAGLFFERWVHGLGIMSECKLDIPSKAWVGSYLKSFVRTEFSNKPKNTPAPSRPNISDQPQIISRNQAVLDYIKSCEERFVFDGVATAIARENGGDPAEQIYSLLIHPELGNRKNVSFLEKEKFVSALRNKIERRERLIFVFPGFPFKDQNPFRVGESAGSVDFSEISLLVRLHTLAVAIYQVYQVGAEWLIVQDGHVFERALRIDRKEVDLYKWRLRIIRDDMDIGRAISFVDFEDVIRLRGYNKTTWTNLIKGIKLSVYDLLKHPNFSNISTSLKLGMKRNANFLDLIKNYSWSDRWHLLYSKWESVPSQLEEAWKEVDRIAFECAVEYASFSVAAAWAGLLTDVFPDAIRATVHAKSNQLAIPRMGTEFPWNSLGFVGSAKINSSSVTCKSLVQLDVSREAIRHLDEAGAFLFCSYDRHES